MDTKLLALIVVVLLAITYLCSCYEDIQEYFFKSEKFQTEPTAATAAAVSTTTPASGSSASAPAVSVLGEAMLDDAIYAIKNFQSIDLTSSAFTPVQCNNFLIGTSQPSQERDWRIKNVQGQPGVIQLIKPAGNECLFAGLDNQLKSYFWSDASCPKRTNLCGLDTSDYRGDLDPQSMPTYFKIHNTNQPGKYVIKSLDSNKFICLMNNQVSMQMNPDATCLFTIQRA